MTQPYNSSKANQEIIRIDMVVSKLVQDTRKGFANEVCYDREWVQTTLMPGVKPEMLVTSRPLVKDVSYEVLTPRQIKVICSVVVTVDEIRLEHESTPFRLRRKHQTHPDIIPKAVSQMDVVTIIPVPDQQFPVKKINTLQIDCLAPVNTVLKNRVITKSQLSFVIRYTAFATKETFNPSATIETKSPGTIKQPKAVLSRPHTTQFPFR
jgi:hypothetical protein